METGHEVDDNVVNEDPDSRERYIGQQVGNWVCAASVHAVARLKVVMGENTASWNQSRKLTCLFKIERPNIIRGISPNESKMETTRAKKMTLPRVKPPAAVSGRLK